MQRRIRQFSVLDYVTFYEETFPILTDHFAPLCEFIDAALQDPSAKVYNHCHAGQNRSATLAIAYACRASGCAAADMIHRVRMNSRRLVVTNKGFEQQLTQRYL